MRRYTIVLIPDADEGGYTVTVPSLPGCVTEGDTFEEALENAREAITVHLEALAADGEPLPEEQGQPELAVVEV
jgi:predicted RNase H-like HicB family nuclease